jgi:hypothetical protein
VLHAANGADHVFMVDDAGTRYRHTVVATAGRA